MRATRRPRCTVVAETGAIVDFSAADIMMSFPLEAAAARGGLTAATHPKLSDFLSRIHARPAYQRALERGGPFALLT